MRGLKPLALASAVLGLAAPAAHAQSSAAQKAALEVYQDYAVDGRIDPCKHSSKTLKLALDNVPPDIEQYASEYPSEIQSAIEARARGECAGSKPDAAVPGVVPPAGGGGVPTPGAPTPVPTPVTTQVPTKTVVPEPPGPDATAAAGAAAAATPAPTATDTELVSGSASNDAPLPVLLLGVLIAVLALTALTFATLRRFGIADDRLAPVGHAFREARWRAGGTWEDFVDWVRTGR